MTKNTVLLIAGITTLGSQALDTSLAAWVMVMLYSRFVVTILFNVFLIVCVLVECGDRYSYDDEDVQASIQLVLTTLALCQYFCVIDLLRELPLLLYIRILYFHNPSTCDTRVYIGQAIDGMVDQASVLITSEALPTFRTFIINAVHCGLSLAWIATSGALIYGGAKNNRSAHIRWPWMAVMVVVFAVDICATVTYITDSFRTRTLTELVEFVGGVLSGAGSQALDTSLAAWVMVMLYSRFVVTILFNVFLIVCVLVECGDRYSYDDEDAAGIEKVEAGAAAAAAGARIPRASLLRRLPSWLARPPRRPEPGPALPRARRPYQPPRSPPAQAAEADKHRVNFPPALLSLPQRLESLMAEQQKRLDSTVVDTAVRWSPPPGAAAGRWSPQTGCSVSQLGDAGEVHAKGRRGTAVELQGQLPWSYTPAAAHRMRDQLPPDEDLPPVPVPDYTLHSNNRKCSVHRAGSNVSQCRTNHTASPLPRSHQQITELDVLY